MKKVLVSALVLALATVSVFASITFSGEIVAGYSISINDHHTDDTDYYGQLYGQDGADSEYAKLNVTVANEEGSVKATLDGTMVADNRLGADISFDIVKLFGLDTDLKLTFGSVYNDRISALRAYNNSYALGGNVDRIRTVNSGIGFYVDLGYGDLVTGRLGVVPKINDSDCNGGTQHFSATASVLVKPIDGVKVSAGYVYYPDNSAERYLSLDHDSTSDADHAWAAAVDWDIAGTFDLDFDIGLSASYVGAYREDLDDEVGTIIAATVYGGYDFISAGVEFGVVINPVQSYAADQDTQLTLQVAADLDLIDNLPISVFFGSSNLEEFEDSWFIGASVGYVLKGIGFNLQVEYAGEDSDTNNYVIVDGEGFTITPYISFTF